MKRVYVIDQLLPDGVAAAEEFHDRLDAMLFPDEAAQIQGAVEARRREFATGRLCARRALSELGFPAAPILSGGHREPRWPAGVVGSITHCIGYRGAAVAPDRHLQAIGIDAEPDEPLPSGVFETIATGDEATRVTDLLDTAPEVNWDRLLFCAKESIYKAWYPIAQRWLGFEDAVVTLDRAARTFTAEILIAGPLTRLTGQWLVERGLVLTAVTVPRPYTLTHGQDS
jgi:4'-phosphopantetheinyl transferase EntD